MARPTLLRIVPNRFKPLFYYNYYYARHGAWLDLFKAAPLALCPNILMYGLIPGDAISGCIAFNGFYEWGLTRRIVEHAARGGLFVDVGANMGYFSLLWAGVSRSGRAVAFEAAPRNIELFQNNVTMNRLEDRITLVPKAAGDHAGTIMFNAGPPDQTGWGGISRNPSPNAITLPLVRLDEQLPDTYVDVLKIDVEGADTLVLFGCERLLKRRRIQVIYFEQNPARMEQLGIALEDAQRFLRSVGYECRSIRGDEGEWLAHPSGA